MNVDTHRGYTKKPKSIRGYGIESYYCECGCKKTYYYYFKLPEKKKYVVFDKENLYKVALSIAVETLQKYDQARWHTKAILRREIIKSAKKKINNSIK